LSVSLSFNDFSSIMFHYDRLTGWKGMVDTAGSISSRVTRDRCYGVENLFDVKFGDKIGGFHKNSYFA
jgi:hypothetical protein